MNHDDLIQDCLIVDFHLKRMRVLLMMQLKYLFLNKMYGYVSLKPVIRIISHIF